MKAAEYLVSRGWWKDAEGCGDDGEGELEWLDPQYESIYPLTRAVTIQRARDAAEERRCVADAIANAASRYCRASDVVAMEMVNRAAAPAAATWRECFAVEVES